MKYVYVLVNKTVNKINLNITEKNVVSMDLNLYITSYIFTVECIITCKYKK